MDINLVIVERTFDVGMLIDILTNDEIFDSISEDNATFEALNFDVIHEHWVSVVVDKKAIGVANFKQMFSKTYDCHIHILPEYRREYAGWAGEMLIRWCDEHLPGCLLYTNVPVFCENVKNFLIKFGFKESGLLTKAWTKNGKLNDMWILTRNTSCQ